MSSKMTEKQRTGRDFLESMIFCGSVVDHQDDCGHCGRQLTDAAAAREILDEYGDGEIPMQEAVTRWADRADQMWHESKYYKLWKEEEAAGRDPKKAFEERGWEP